MPAAGHIVHMPAHIYIRVGRYEDAIERNQHAVHADETLYRRPASLRRVPPRLLSRTTITSSRSRRRWPRTRTRRWTRRATWRRTPTARCWRIPDLGGTLQHFITTEVSTLVAVRAGGRRCSQQPAVRRPSDLPAGTLALRAGHGVRGHRPARRGRRRSSTRCVQLVNDPATAAVAIFGLNTGPQILAVAERVLSGRLAAARGEVDEAVRHPHRRASSSRTGSPTTSRRTGTSPCARSWPRCSTTRDDWTRPRRRTKRTS